MSITGRAFAVLAILGVFGAWAVLQLPTEAQGQQQVQVQVARKPVVLPAPIPPGGEPGKDNELTDAISFPKDTKAKKSLDAAEDFIKEGAWGEAAHVLQSLLNKKEDSFVRVVRKAAHGGETPHWVSIRSEANRLLGTMPPNGLQVYELQFGGKAKELLDEAKRAPEERTTDELKQKSAAQILADVAQRYLHTKAGSEATSLLGTFHLSRGEAERAALCFKHLLAKEEVQPTPATLLKATLAFQRTGDKPAAGQTWQRLVKLSPTGVRIGDRNIPLDELRKELDQAPSQVVSLSAHDWAMFKGNVSRSAHGNGDTPFLDEELNRWEQPTIRENQTKTWVDQAVSYQESRQQSAILPAFFPVAGGGKLVFRSYFGVHAVDLKTGKLQWEQESYSSIDSMVKNPRKMVQLNQWIPMYLNGGNQSILFENSTLGTLSTDNQLVFAVDDLALPPHPQFLQQFMWGGRPNYGELEDAVNHNKLVAIELETGKLKWQLGGRGEKGELNDSFFLGTPLPLAGKLYVLTEKNAELRLVCMENLNTREPTISWVQTLASVQHPVSRDVTRRVNAANLAYGDGILVCPTNAGAILGVDLLTHSLVWAHPYREGSPAPQQPEMQPNFRGRFPVQYNFGQSLNPDWKCSAPIVADGKVVFTAPDGMSIHCLNLRDGTSIWKAGRSDDLYLGGIHNGKVLLIGKNSARALALADGKQLWVRETGLPSGQGVASDKTYYLPIKSSAASKEPEVCAIDMDTGNVVAHTKTRKKEIPGNLIFYEGKVISQNAYKVTAYPQLKVKLAEMNAKIDKNPKDPVGLTERAELRRNKGDVADAVEDLRVALANNPNAEIMPKARQLLFECLTELFQRDFNASVKYLDEYREMCKVEVPADATPEKRKELADEHQRRQANFLCLVAKGREQQGNLLEAFKCYMEFGGLGDKTGLLTVIDEPTVKARPDVWAQGRIAAMVAKAQDPAKRKQLEEEIAKHWKDIQGASDTEKLRNFVAVFGSLFAVGKDARLQLAERLIDENKDGSLLEAELQLLQVRRGDDPQRAARAVEMLARLMTRKNMLEDAAYWYRILGREFATTIIRDGKTGADFVNDLATDKRFLPYLDEPTTWNTGKGVKAREEFGTFQQMHQIFYFEPEGEALPFFQRHRLAFNLNFYQIKMIDRATNEERWSQNLTRNQNNNNLQYLYWNQNNPNGPSIRFPYYVNGHMAVFNLGIMVYGFDLVERKVLWERNLFGTETLPINQIMPNPMGGLNAMYPDGRVERIGQTGPCEPGYVCLQTRQGLVALDPIKGTVLWTKADVSAWTQVSGDDDHLYMIEVRNDGSVGAGKAVRAHDGVAVNVPDFSGPYQHRIHIHGRHLLTSEPKNAGMTLRLYDILTGKDAWKKEFGANSIVLRSEDPGIVGVIEKGAGGKLTVFDVRTQKEVLNSTVDPKDVENAQSVHLLQDSERIYVAVNGPPNPQLNPWGGPWSNLMNGMRGIMVNGRFYAFDRATGKKQWHAEVPSQVLILDQYKDLPILLFTSRSQKLINGGVMQVTATKSLAKRTGKLIYDKELQNNGTQFHSLNTNMKAGTIDLVSYNMRIQHYVER